MNRIEESLSELRTSLEGSLFDTLSERDAAGRDYGRIVHESPLAVIRPASAADVVKSVRFAVEHGVPLAARGQGHTTFGQAQARGGLVLDMSSLNRIREFDGQSVLVEGGAKWAAVVEQTLSRGLIPPALTDFLHLSVAGTLSVGGIGGASFRHGAQVDNVLELEVVTGAGEHVRCSPESNAELFDACRAGLGQCGVITAARLRLVPAAPRVRVYTLRYERLAPYLADQTRLAEEGRFDYLDGTIIAEAPGRYTYTLSAALLLGDAEPERPGLLEGLGFTGEPTSEKLSHAAFSLRVDGYVEMMRRTGLWETPHPWVDLFIPASRAEAFFDAALSQLESPRDGMILSYVLRRSRCHAPMLRLPDEERFFLFDLLRNVPGASSERIQHLLETNARLWRECIELGGTMYPIGAVPLSPDDWRRQYGPAWERLMAARRRFNPSGLLGPGPRLLAPSVA